MLGIDMVTLLRERGETVTAATRADVDVTDPTQLDAAIANADIVVNCAAYTAVDQAETDEDTAYLLNATAAGLIANACKTHSARLVHISTDYVFDGTATEPYAEDAPVNPVSAYGRTKAAGEKLIHDSGADALIVRTAWLYGAHGNCFPKTILRLAKERDEISVVNDQWGQPTWTIDLADLIHRLIKANAPAGIYHGTSSGKTTWHGFAQAIVTTAGLATRVNPTDSTTFQRPAPRPTWSVLAHDTLTVAGVDPIGAWQHRWRESASQVLS